MTASKPLWFVRGSVLLMGLAATVLAAPWPEPAELPVRATLPDPLVGFDGRRVETRTQWSQQRRPELQALFQHYMYGYLPPKPGAPRYTIGRTDTSYFSGRATKKEVTISFGGELPRIHLLVVIPNKRAQPAPVFLGMNFCGNHAVVNDAAIPLSSAWFYNNCKGCTNNHATEASRGTEVNTWALEPSVEQGYAVATFYSGDIVPDRADAIQAVRRALDPPTAERTNDFGAIAAWAWGFHRCVDYLVTDRDLDARRIAAVGHSRNGKTALLAAAFDERIALAIPLQAGCGGTAPSRGKIGESVKQINDRFPHWFNGRFKQFNDQPERLPFDQHALIALCAPRPVLLPNAVEDTWANPEGQFEMLRAAAPVYELLGVKAFAADQMPPLNQLVNTPLGYFIRPGKHSMTTNDWSVFREFASKHL